jgi:WD40 repeat protein
MSESRDINAARRPAILGVVARLAAWAAAWGAMAATTAVADELPAKVTYQEHIRPIFQEHCFACHSQDERKSDLALDNYANALKGGAGGEVLFAADLDNSRLWHLVNHEDSPEMPPGQDKLAQPKLDLIKAWIEGGLLENAGSKAKPAAASPLGKVATTADNRPVGEPAMPVGVFREPLVTPPQPGATAAIATSPWAPLAAVAAPRQASLYDTNSGELLGVLPYPEGSPQALRFSRDGSLVVVAGGHSAASGNAAVFDVKSGARVATIGEEVDAVLAADISPDHSLVAIGGPKKVVRVYRVADGTLAYEIRKHTDWVTAIEFSPDGKLLATGDRSGGLFLWDGPAGHERGDLRGHQEQVTSLSWRADSQVIASSSEDDTVRLWQTNGNQLKSIGAHSGGALSVHFSRDGNLTSAGRDAMVKTWSADGNPVKDVAKLDDVALAARFTHDGAHVLASDWRGRVQLFDANTAAAGHVLPPNPPSLATRIELAAAKVEPTKAAVEAAAAEASTAASQLAAATEAHAAFDKELSDAQAAVDALNSQRAATAAAQTEAATAWQRAADAATGAATAWTNAEKAAAAGGEQAAEAERLRVEWQAAEAALTAAKQRNAEATLASDKAAADFAAAADKLAQIAARRATLADLGPLKASADEKSAQAAAAKAAAEDAQAAHAKAVAELAAFHGASERFVAQAAEREQALAAINGEIAAAAAARDQVAAKMTEHEAAAAELAAQVAALEAKQAELKKAQDQTAQEVAAAAEQLAAREAAAAEVRRAATLDEAIKAQLEAAAAVRAKYQTAAGAK